MTKLPDRVRKMQFVSRMPYRAWRAWVTFDETDYGQVYFSDTEYGSKEASLVAAQQHRDALITTHNIPLRVYDGNGFYVKHSGSSTALVGVTLYADDLERPTRANWSVVVRYEGKSRRRTFSIRRYGYAEAFLMAARIRVAHTGQEIPPVPPPPPWLVAWAKTYAVDLADQKNEERK